MPDYVIVWNGVHAGQDRDLLRPIDWLEQKEKPLTIKGGRSACTLPTPRTQKQQQQDRDLAIALRRSGKTRPPIGLGGSC